MEKIQYPITKKGNDIISYFNKNISDPYEWLEDNSSYETSEWVKEQNKVTFNYLSNISQKNKWKKQLEQYWNYEKKQIPFKKGSFLYYYKNNGLQNQNILYREDSKGNSEIFLDPNSFSDDGTTSLESISYSKNSKYVAYSISEGGSDWRKVYVLDVESKKLIESPLINIKFSFITWNGDEGFFYSSYDKPTGSELSEKTDQHKLYYHKLYTDQANDLIVFGNEIKRRYVGGRVTENSKYLIIYAAESTYGNELYLVNLRNSDFKLQPIVKGFNFHSHFICSNGNYVFIQTDLNAPNSRLMKVDLSSPELENWEEIISEKSEVLEVTSGGGFLFAHYLVNAISQVSQYDYNGNLIRNIDLPGIGTVNGFNSDNVVDQLYYSFTNFITPGHIYSYNMETGKSSLYWKPSIDIKAEDFVCEQKFYKSKDDTKIPMFVTYKKEINLDGKNPTILYGYGGFNISMTPFFSISNLVWLLNGGIFAVANLRGGGEYGKKWHLAGTKMKKQNVFDDFIAGAEYLINNLYTSSDYLAIEGRSNGGLLVGACMTQRPDLFKVAIPCVGVLDMLKYHTFTAGAGWSYDYGNAEESSEMFDYLLSYSPVHNVKEGVQYPATLVNTADHDDRVVPSHSYKFIANLQEKQSGENPVLIRIDTNAGHGAGKPVSMVIEERADIYAFIFHNMGLEKKML